MKEKEEAKVSRVKGGGANSVAAKGNKNHASSALAVGNEPRAPSPTPGAAPSSHLLEKDASLPSLSRQQNPSPRLAQASVSPADKNALEASSNVNQRNNNVKRHSNAAAAKRPTVQ